MFKKEHKPKESSQVEVHDVSHHLSSKQKIFVYGVVLVLVLLSAGWLVVQKYSKPKVVIPDTALKATSVAQIQELDSTIRDNLISSNPDPKKNPAAAQAKALALASNGDFNQSLDVYAAITKENVSFAYYLNYGLTAAQSGDLKLGISLLQKSLTVLKNEKGVPEEVKNTEKENIETKIELLQAEVAND